MPDEILDRLTWQDVAELEEYWADHPPLQWMIQGFLGIKPKKRGAGNPTEFRELVKQLNRK